MTVSNYGRHGKRVTKAYHVFFNGDNYWYPGLAIGEQVPKINSVNYYMLVERHREKKFLVGFLLTKRVKLIYVLTSQ